MASVLAIVSKAVFEKQGGALGAVLPTDRYASTHASLDQLAAGGAIFLVTVRPPDEALWLVAIVEGPAREAAGWVGAANATPITDITALRSRLRFSTGAGLQAKPGALGMSLQTPRTLTDEDVALLRGAAGGERAANPAKTSAGRTKVSGARTKPATAAAKAAPVAPRAPGQVGAGLPGVAAALAAKDPAAALLAALAWWRAEPQPALADLVDAISARVSGPPVTDQQIWAKLGRTRDPLILGQLLAGVPELTASFLPTAGALLEGFSPDPRIPAAVARWALDPPTTSSSTYPFWTKVLDLAATAGDVRVIPVLGKRLTKPKGPSQFWPKFYTALARVRDRLAALPAPPKPAPAIAKLVAGAAKLPPLGPLRASGIVAAAARPRATAPVLTGPLLAQASTHLAAGRVVAAIDALVAHWRQSRVAEVAELVDQATRLLPTWDRPLAASEKAMQAAWEEAFTAPAERMPQLLQNLTVGAPKQLELRLVDLANLGDDPRISLRLAQLASSCRVSPERAQFWRAVWELLARHRDMRTAAPLLREFNSFVGRWYDHHAQGRRIFLPFAQAATAPELDAADRKLAGKLATELGAAEARARKIERGLIAAIAEAPSDPGLRAVYADWLLEQGHPRGALINGDTSHADTPHLFGPLDDLGDFALDRGLPTQLEIDADTGTLLWRELAGHPLLGIVETIAFDAVYGEDQQPGADVLAPIIGAAPRLARIKNLQADVVAELARTTKGFVAKRKQLVRA